METVRSAPVRTSEKAPARPGVLAFAIDHRWQLESMADEIGAPYGRIRELKAVLFEAYAAIASEEPRAGLIIDDKYGGHLVQQASDLGNWLARAIEEPSSYPLRLVQDRELEQELASWPKEHVVKCMVYAQQSESESVRRSQDETIRGLWRACSAAGNRLLVELQRPDGALYSPGEIHSVMQWIYELGVLPHWWKLPPAVDPKVWEVVHDIIVVHDPSSHGFLVLGQGATIEDAVASLQVASSFDSCNGFAIGRSVFNSSAMAWMSGEASSTQLISDVAVGLNRLIEAWV